MTQQEQELKKQNDKPKTIKTKNPATEEILNEYDILTKEQINEAAKKAKDTFQKWSTISLEKRIGYLHDFAAQLRKNIDHLARTATLEMGKAIKEARSEFEKCAWAIEYFADNGSNGYGMEGTIKLANDTQYGLGAITRLETLKRQKDYQDWFLLV
jgi:acyl-CoA reductase-like NAD-dependent aldehyde dehydrogenase